MKTPVALFAFNRADSTALVLDAIRKAKPESLYLICDGARPDRPGETDAVRQLLSNIDWDCAIYRNYSDVNLGADERLISGLNWLFACVEEAIILEDDCVPSSSFFDFACETLVRYRCDKKIMMISGFNGLGASGTCNQNVDSYFFAHSVGIWGWATWRRAWKHFNRELSDWPIAKSSCWVRDLYPLSRHARYWTQLFDYLYSSRRSWDCIWLYSVWRQNGLCVIPASNLVENIGFVHLGQSKIASETNRFASYVTSLKSTELPFPLTHPRIITRDRQYDEVITDLLYIPSATKSRVRQYCELIFSGDLPGLVARCWQLLIRWLSRI